MGAVWRHWLHGVDHVCQSLQLHLPQRLVVLVSLSRESTEATVIWLMALITIPPPLFCFHHFSPIVLYLDFPVYTFWGTCCMFCCWYYKWPSSFPASMAFNISDRRFSHLLEGCCCVSTPFLDTLIRMKDFRSIGIAVCIYRQVECPFVASQISNS